MKDSTLLVYTAPAIFLDLLFLAKTTGTSKNSATMQAIPIPEASIVSIFVRKPTGISHPKLKEYVVNYDHLSLVKDKIVSDVIFNCLGTTLKVAGSKENQQIIDRDYPIVVAKIASENGVKKIINVGI